MKPSDAAPKPYPPFPADLLHIDTLPLRVQRMIALLLAHEAVICQYAAGSVELHFHEEHVLAKLGSVNLSR